MTPIHFFKCNINTEVMTFIQANTVSNVRLVSKAAGK